MNSLKDNMAELLSITRTVYEDKTVIDRKYSNGLSMSCIFDLQPHIDNVVKRVNEQMDEEVFYRVCKLPKFQKMLHDMGYYKIPEDLIDD